MTKRIATCLIVLITMVSVAGCGSKSDTSTATAAKPKPAAAKEITITVYSGRKQPPPETWTASLGQEVAFKVEGLVTKVGIVGPGLGKPYKGSYGLTNVTGDKVADVLKFTPSEQGEYRVSQIESSVLLGTLKVE